MQIACNRELVRDRTLLIHHSLSTLQVALIGLVIGVLLAAGFAFSYRWFQCGCDLVYPLWLLFKPPFERFAGYPGFLGLAMVCFKN